jgi:hypothetical protein
LLLLFVASGDDATQNRLNKKNFFLTEGTLPPAPPSFFLAFNNT